jgi:uncharacterized membrane protein
MTELAAVPKLKLKPPLGAAYDPRGAGGRLLISSAIGVATGVLLPEHLGWATRLIVGWDVGATVLLGLVWFFVLASDPVHTRCRAAAADPGRTAVWLIVVVASCVSLFAAAGAMRHSGVIAPASRALLIVASLVAVIMAWTLTHSSFTLRYAHLYYRDDDEGEGGLDFPGQRAPDDFDFAYFAFTVGMCFQASDVVITSRQIRRVVLAHALLSFCYNTVILAMALNLLFGMLS